MQHDVRSSACGLGVKVRPMNQNTAEVDDVFNRVHGQSGPRSDVDIFVM